MKRRFGGVLASASLILSCGDSGQTGSADCAPRPLSCECAAFADKHLVKASVLELNDGIGTLEIEQVLIPNRYLDQRAEHRRVTGTFTPGIACGTADNDLPQVSDTVFAAFASYGDEDPIMTDALVQPWADTVDLGNQTTVPQSEAIALTDAETCDARYPASPAPPCNDTSTTCALSIAHPTHAPSAAWLVSFVLGLAVLRVRRRR